jgi:Spy/CpxP family protein refolding chaperone
MTSITISSSASSTSLRPRSPTRRRRQTAALAALAKPQHVDEAALGAQLDRVLEVEREAKHVHLALLTAIKNLLTPDQQTQLRKIAE